jgi:hypothetical protein
VAQQLLILQSLWAMERAHPEDPERPLEEKLKMILEAGYDGFGVTLTEPETARRVGEVARNEGKIVEGLWFPKTVDDLKPGLERAAAIGVHHLNIQPDVRPRRLEESLRILEGWQRLAEEVDFPVYIETHRDRLTNDLLVTLDILDRLPELKLLADLSHYVVAREMAWPIDVVRHEMIRRVLDAAWAFHGRVASSEQVQVELSFPQHRKWLELFLDWWTYGFRSWRERAGPDDVLTFVCELGPQPYAISDRRGRDSTDRWAEALTMRDLVRAKWDALEGDPA